MNRRTFLRVGSGAVGASLAGCITVGGETNEHVQWSTELGADPEPVDARGIAVANDTVAAVTDERLFGVTLSGELRWETFERATGVFGIGDGFVGVDWPNYHPRNRTNEAAVTRLGSDGVPRWAVRREELLDLAVGSDRVLALHGAPSQPELSALALADGTERWSTGLSHPATGVRLSAGHAITCGDELVAYDSASGRFAWSVDGFDRARTPAVDGDRVYLTSQEAPFRVLVVDATDGTPGPEYEFGDGLAPNAPLVVHEGVGLGAGYADDERPFFAIDAATGDVRWWTTPEEHVNLHSSPRTGVTFLDGTAYVFTYKHVLRAIDLADGSVQWTFDTERSYPLVAAGRDSVHVLAGETLYALDPTTDG